MIPAYGESEYLSQTLASLEANDSTLLKNTLVIIVVNNSAETDIFIKNDNKKSLQFLSTAEYRFTLGVADATTPGLELPSKKAGVGLARKIGMDLALPYLSNSRSLLLCTDADTSVDIYYLETVLNYFNKYNADSGVVGFRHSTPKDSSLKKAIREYEKFLSLTAKKIKETGSPYGYVSMGSTMACTVKAYISVGGMPQKKATEDFYFLQELSKFCGVHTIPDILVYPSPRPIGRVYLGTGFRMKQVQKGLNIGNLYYSDYAFNILREWLKLGCSSWQVDLDELLVNASIINPDLKELLIQNNIENIWRNLQLSSPSENHFTKQFHCWFDGLKTIRLLKHFTKTYNI